MIKKEKRSTDRTFLFESYLDMLISLEWNIFSFAVGEMSMFL